jgi:anti-sigma-K factor RskA
VNPPPPDPASPHPAAKPAASRFGFVPWAIAASLAVTSFAFWSERAELAKDVAALRIEALALRTRDEFSKMKIATLTAQNEAYAKGLAVVVWDAEKQQGIVKLANIPTNASGHDYQLWIIDPKYPQPVSAGIVPVGADGLARVAFTPEHLIRSAEKFAISIEQAGGAPTPGGPIILLGN